MTDHPSIPPIDPAYIAEVKSLIKASAALLGLVVPFAERTGEAMAQMDALKEAAGDTDAALEELHAITGYRELLDNWYALAGHASAAADHHAYMAQPDWYNRLTEQRHARFAAEVA